MTALLRLARCRHPNEHRAKCYHWQNCELCGSVRRQLDPSTLSRWTRPKLVADLIAEKKERGK